MHESLYISTLYGDFQIKTNRGATSLQLPLLEKPLELGIYHQ
ncbi:hypothetical protein MTBBW1_850007 [Desulfamplus magnetovallimortis]|uniref:Uncharacterized protein n=1 Tax=Desulfamplus magnetovallimortis TaxID=1246637 RepID=A0A1W1HKM1_9BACT|nr:hypothetical protein MTBBW1_850007 [Desulfamplus magnetovallimortis]